MEKFLSFFRLYVIKAESEALRVLLQTCMTPVPVKHGQHLWMAMDDDTLPVRARVELLDIFLHLFGRWTEVFELAYKRDTPEMDWIF